ncbi:TPA: hypothetical protein HA273_02945 [Candidatus Bathyarchaeota archaeon]|nr:hypothetical protein [Candidatus Bathyarchaeota archaeon]
MEVYLMAHEVDYATAETRGCSSKLTIENKIFYVKLFGSSTQPSRYFAGDKKGIITKEISKTEFDFWLRALANEEEEIKQIRKKIDSGKKYL